jgi:hypothetical protein
MLSLWKLRVVILDYGSEFKMEIVPGYRDLRTEEKRASGSPPHLVPDGSGNWKIADYATDALVISAINSLSNGKLVPAIKLMKGFVRSRGLQFKSFAVELFCSINFYDINEQVEKSGVPWSYAKIFAYLLHALPKMLTVPLGFHLSDSEKQTLMPSYDYFVEASCSSAAAVAANALTLGDTYDGVNAWRQLYGHPFPPPEAL